MCVHRGRKAGDTQTKGSRKELAPHCSLASIRTSLLSVVGVHLVTGILGHQYLHQTLKFVLALHSHKPNSFLHPEKDRIVSPLLHRRYKRGQGCKLWETEDKLLPNPELTLLFFAKGQIKSLLADRLGLSV